MATSIRGDLLPIQQTLPRVKAAQMTPDIASLNVYCQLRRVRADKRFKGKREKKAREAADEGLGAKR